MKRLLISFILLLSLGSTSFAADPFPDVSPETRFYDSIIYVKDQGYVQGFGDGLYRPEHKISRYEFIKIVVSVAYTKEEIAVCDLDAYLTFPDVPKDEWFSPYVCIGSRDGIINGFADGRFGGTHNVTTPEALKMLFGVYNIDVDTYKGEGYEQWHVQYQKAADDLLRRQPINDAPDYYINRAQTAELVFQVDTMNEVGDPELWNTKLLKLRDNGCEDHKRLKDYEDLLEYYDPKDFYVRDIAEGRFQVIVSERVSGASNFAFDVLDSNNTIIFTFYYVMNGTTMDLSPDTTQVAFIGSYDGNCEDKENPSVFGLLDLSTKEFIEFDRSLIEEENDGSYTFAYPRLSWSNEGNYVVTGQTVEKEDEYQITLYDPNTGDVVKSLRLTEGQFYFPGGNLDSSPAISYNEKNQEFGVFLFPNYPESYE